MSLDDVMPGVTLVSTTNEGTSSGNLYFWTEKEATIQSDVELFGFGSGTWVEGGDAQSLQNEVEAAWIPCVFSPDSLVILEKAGVSTEVAALEFVKSKKINTLGAVLLELETLGETNVDLTSHSVKRDNAEHIISMDNTILFKLTCKEPFVYIMIDACSIVVS